MQTPQHRFREHERTRRQTNQGVEIAAREKQTPESLAAIQRAEIKKWWPIIDAAGIKPQ